MCGLYIGEITCARDELDNGETYGGEILHANLRGAWEGHGLGLTSIGVFIGKKIHFLEVWFCSGMVCIEQTGLASPI